MTLPITNKFLVASHKHGLLPFAFKLKKEGMDVQVVVWKDRYEKAWSGLLDQPLTGDTKRHDRDGARPFDPWVEQALSGELIVLTDSKRIAEIFEGAPHLFARIWGDGWTFTGLPSLLLGAWFSSERFWLPHWVVPDWGTWPGGLGPTQLGGATLITQDPFLGPIEFLEKRKDELQEHHFKGLVLVGLGFNQVSKAWEDKGVIAGWPFLGTHVFVSHLPSSLSGLLLGLDSERPRRAYTVGLPISVPPWPSESNVSARQLPLKGLTTELMRDIFFHDISTEGKEVKVAGLDGLVGIATTSANSSGLARAKAVQVAAALQLFEKQYRMDVGAQVEGVLAGLETLGIW